jgi:hypothetical protein
LEFGLDEEKEEKETVQVDQQVIKIDSDQDINNLTE